MDYEIAYRLEPATSVQEYPKRRPECSTATYQPEYPAHPLAYAGPHDEGTGSRDRGAAERCAGVWSVFDHPLAFTVNQQVTSLQRSLSQSVLLPRRLLLFLLLLMLHSRGNILYHICTLAICIRL